MKHAITLVCALMFIPCTAVAEPIVVRPGVPHLFVDDLLIESQSNLKRTLHAPVKDNGGNAPLLALADEVPAPATLEANGTILYDPRLKKWVMFALSFSSSLNSQDRVRLYRFTSDDAMNWIKGDDGRPEHIRFDLLDKASGRQAGNHDLFSCCYDQRDAEFPYQGWLFISNFGDRYDLEGLYFVRSRDGKTWERGRQVADAFAGGSDTTYREITQDGRTLRGPGDGSIFYFDEIDKRYLALFKFYSPSPVPPNNYLRSRAYLFVDRLDEPIDFKRIERVNLVPPAAEAGGEQRHDEYYISTAYRYGSHWLGELKIWHGGGDYPHSPAGSAFIKFMTSSDGLRWKKAPFANDDGVAEVFIPNGREGGNDGKNDGGYITLFSQGPLRVGDELIYYYGASSWGKNHPHGKRVTGGGIFRARLRPDGFVSVDSGTLTTRPIRLQGRELLLNGVGPITAELLDDRGAALATQRLTGDSLSHPIPLHERTARLRFTIEPGGKLYSFATQ